MPPEPAVDSVSRGYTHEELRSYTLRLLGGLLLLFLLVVLSARHYRAELEILGHGFVERLGFAGMALGTFLADGFHLPIPPQAYMLMSISSGASATLSFLAIALGSLLGGSAAYFIGRRISSVRWLRRWLAPLQHMFERLWDRFGHRALLVASIAPVPYSTLCWLTGINRLPTSAYGLLALLRVPRLAVFYLLIWAGWRI